MRDCEFPEEGIDGYMEHLREKAYERRIPFKGGFELTPRCNFNCNMCYVHLQPEQISAVGRELTAQEWIGIGKDAQKAGTIELTLTGGEPFVRPDFREIYEALHDMGFFIQIFSNGFLLDEHIIEWLKKRPPRTMRFTLYGASDESYRKVCGVENGFTRVKRSVELLRKAGIPLYLVATFTKENQHEFEAVYRFAAEHRLPIAHTSNLIPPVRGATADVDAHQIERILPPEEEIRRLREHSNGRFPRKRCEDFLKVCGNYRRGYWITWGGEMQLCTFLSEPSVTVRPGTFQESWEQLQEKIDGLRQPQKCLGCPYEGYCERCPGVLYAESGACDRTSERFCRQAEFCYELYGKPLDEK